MKKGYTKPTIVKVELNHEQAVLGACSGTGTSTRVVATTACQAAGCKQYNRAGDDAPSS